MILSVMMRTKLIIGRLAPMHFRSLKLLKIRLIAYGFNDFVFSKLLARNQALLLASVMTTIVFLCKPVHMLLDLPL